jgi:hypothetical protein
MSCGSATDQGEKRFSLAPAMNSSTQWSTADHRLQLGSRAGSASEDGVDAAEIEEEGRDDETTRLMQRGEYDVAQQPQQTTRTVAPL